VGKEGTKKRGPKYEPKEQNPKWVTTNHQNKLCFKAPHQSKDTYMKGKELGNL
jgi:hypothetical protein